MLYEYANILTTFWKKKKPRMVVSLFAHTYFLLRTCILLISHCAHNVLRREVNYQIHIQFIIEICNNFNFYLILSICFSFAIAYIVAQMCI